ncbi:MAG: hypothetical protein ACK551_07035 [Vampirovibrionales bacterium]
MNMNIGGFNAAPKFFQIQAGKLDQQAKAFILKNDTNKDGELSQAEVQAAGGLTPGVRSKVSSASIATSLWAGVSGPGGGIGAKEYAQFLVALDFDRDGKITQDESDATMASWSNFIQENPTVAHSSIYSALVQKGKEIGLDKVLDNSEEEQLAEDLAIGKNPSSTTPTKPPVTEDAGLPIVGGTTAGTSALVIPSTTTAGTAAKLQAILLANDTGLPVVGGTTVALATPAPTTTSGSLADRLKAVPGLDSSIIASLVAVVGDSIKTPAAETIDLPLI